MDFTVVLVMGIVGFAIGIALPILLGWVLDDLDY